MEASIEGLAEKAKEALARHQLAHNLVKIETKRLKDSKKRVIRTNKAQQIIQNVAKALQENVCTGIARIVSRCIQTVFQDDPNGPYEFKIQFDRKRGKTEARLVFVRDEEELNPLDEAGGGVIDVAAFALRLACICMEKPASRKILFLDEPFRFVSEEYRSTIGQLLIELSEELDFQIIMVSHMSELQIGKVICL